MYRNTVKHVWQAATAHMLTRTVGAILLVAVAACGASQATGAGSGGSLSLTTNLPNDSASRAALYFVGLPFRVSGWRANSSSAEFFVRDAAGRGAPGVSIHFVADSTYLRLAETAEVTDTSGGVPLPTATPRHVTPVYIGPQGTQFAYGPSSLIVTADGVSDSIVLSFSVGPAQGGTDSIAADRPADLGHFLAGQYVTRYPAVQAFDGYGDRLVYAAGVAWRVVAGAGTIHPDTLGSPDTAFLYSWILGPGPNAVEAYLPAHPGFPPVRFTAEGDTAIAGPLPVNVTVAFGTSRAADWTAAIQNAISRYSQYFTSAFAPIDVDLPANSYGGDSAYSPEIVDSAWTGLHVIFERDAGVATFATSEYVVRPDGTPAVVILYVNPDVFQRLDTSGVLSTQLPLVHEAGHMFGVTNTLPASAIFERGVPGNDPYSLAPTAVAAWRTLAPGLAANGVPLFSPVHSSQPGVAYVHWECPEVPDIMACLWDGATVTAVTVGLIQDANVPIGSNAADPPPIDVSHESVSPQWRSGLGGPAAVGAAGAPEASFGIPALTGDVIVGPLYEAESDGTLKRIR